MAPRTPTPLPTSAEVAWATGVGADGDPSLSWVELRSDAEPWTGAGAGSAAPGEALGERFVAPSHHARLPGATRDAELEATRAPDAPPTGHELVDLVYASPAWLARSRALVYGPWSPIPAALGSVLAAYGVGPEIHGGDPTILRLLAWYVPRWFPTRGQGRSALELLLLAGAADGGGQQATLLQKTVKDLAVGVQDTDRCLAREIFGCWPAGWWRARGWPPDGAPEARLPLTVRDGAVLFQQPGSVVSRPTFRLRPGDVLLPSRPLEEHPVRLAGLVPPWAVVRRYQEESPGGGQTMPERDAADDGTVVVFDPRHGALIDLESLEGISTISKHMSVALEYILPAQSSAASAGLVLEGLDLVGIAAEGGPPGAVEPEVTEDRQLTIRPGVALLRWNGQAVAVRLDEPIRVPLPSDRDVASSKSWAVVLELVPHASGSDGCARQRLQAVVPRPVARHLVDPATQLVLALSIPRTKRWETDLCALWRPDDPRTTRLAQQLDAIAEQVWREAPQGLVWSSAVLGRDWLRYQAGASAALQATGLALESRALTTVERVRLLQSLHRRLVATVLAAAEAVRELFGPLDAKGIDAAPDAPGAPGPVGAESAWTSVVPALLSVERRRGAVT